MKEIKFFQQQKKLSIHAEKDKFKLVTFTAFKKLLNS